MSPTPRSLTRREPKKTTKSSTHIRTHLRYASGAIIHRAEFSSLFAAAYYTPGVLDLLKSMCQPPQSPYSSIVWKIPSTPEMDGKTFSDVFEEMVGVDAIPIGLQVILPSILNHGNPIPPRIREPQEPGTCASEQETLTDGFDTP